MPPESSRLSPKPVMRPCPATVGLRARGRSRGRPPPRRAAGRCCGRPRGRRRARRPPRRRGPGRGCGSLPAHVRVIHPSVSDQTQEPAGGSRTLPRRTPLGEAELRPRDDLVQLRRPRATPPNPTPPAKVAAKLAADKLAADKLAADKLAYVETYGCQMNVADTEMVLGPAARRRLRAHRRSGARRPDPAQHLRRAREGRGAGVRAREHARRAQGAPRRRAGHHRLHGRAPQGRDPRARAVRRRGRRPRRLPPAARARRGARAAARRSTDTRLDRSRPTRGSIPLRAVGDGGGVTGHVTIQRGCDKFCTFCVVPYTRGRERGTPPREVLRQARALAEAGYREVSCSARP